MTAKPESSRQSASVDIEASVQKTETWHLNKKFTVYKVVVVSSTECWFVFRRYNEFYELHHILKKQVPNLQLKFPGKKLFGNNLDPQFVAQRREGLNNFVQQLMQDPKLLNIGEVRTFLQLDGHRPTAEESSTEESCEKAEEDENLNLGPTERTYARPSDFEFLHVIGKGSFGKVLLARHRCDSKYYAVKVLSKRLILRRNEAQHIMSERNVLMKNLHHPFLVGLHFSFQTKDKLFFVLDYVNGGELFFHLQRERTFTEPRARFYAAEVASALGYLHSQGIVYRDLKPENLLLDCTGHVVLTDFGLSKEGLLATDTTNTFCGTPEYLAPEVVRKEPYDRSVDWWCLGAVLYEMLYGLPPFYSRNITEMYDQILYQPLRLRVGPTEAAKRILTELLEKDASQRLGSGYGDFDDVASHEFFRSINWSDLLARKIKPPFNPKVKGELDMQHIDPAFIRESLGSIGLSQTSGALTASVREADEHFVGFSYSYAAPIDYNNDRAAEL
ncbi:serine/threonine-protein kinase Sgk2-like [Macrosteles quadrilineatus]|uniref:serine/threonine-protein kinase Sgk2-like n=1 Tax=Macrosteles quadrilineatus TaxID=74068 RepID=UPI0023E0DA97|nr:serine/threonine-protein kinase Sgk2-like [Macrosteles quadrilineatus]XP_054289395.1 serine/threonine-protein kinase Sgk2-like [Macrosteles quadrilineatus]